MKISDFLKIDYETSLIALTYILGKSKSYVLMNQNLDLNDKQSQRLKDIINKRKDSYPLQYAIGEWEFYNLKLKVDERALIPRFETEIIVDYLIKSPIKKDRILDIGTGTGAIALSLAKNIENSFVLGSDIEEKALSLALENKKNIGIENVDFVRSDLFENIRGKFDFIISNPPYINKKDYESLDRELYFEPKSALYGGEDGLDFYRKIIKKANSYLNDGGHLIFEIGYDQKEVLNRLLTNQGFVNIQNIKDFNDFDRFIIAQKG
ncbi:peptide chain release factor N(5)-glutamine methyltransferase [uncultured Anaerococcus sp.]|uniref:peptide chain release factor N(5)-glutamine methyltransferase n=1 Tax=uncultured Anaerococcus sp. TaxID=293428 RepID=UPI0028893FA8|nr:peptide chain release factor N(5)-glutamine methyltransferase [uncultured Anaerococcus sp.]